MKFKLIMVLAEDELTQAVLETARAHGATGSTVITSARGEGLKPQKTFLGLTVAGTRDVVLLLVEEHLSRQMLEAIAGKCGFDVKPGTGVAFQIDIEDTVGLRAQIEERIKQEVGEGEL